MSHLVHGGPRGCEVAVQGLQVIGSMRLWLHRALGGAGSRAIIKFFYSIHLNASYISFKISWKSLIKIRNKWSLKKFQLLKHLLHCNY